MIVLLIVFTIIVITIVAVIVGVVKNDKNLEITSKHSRLFNEVCSLNERYNFNCIENSILFEPTLKSKRGLENFNIDQYVKSEIESSQGNYIELVDCIEENIEKYSKYLMQYEKMENYTTEEEFAKFTNIKLKYKTFLKCEKILYKELKLKEPIMDLTIKCHATYTSPSGRNYYERYTSYSFNQLKRILKEITLERKNKERLMQEKLEKAKIEREKREKLALEKREKEKKLRELDKREAKLALKEKEIMEKEQEFIEATKEHIYTADKIKIQEQKFENDENLSISQKLQLLREKLDNGEITLEEYQLKRKEVM